MILHQLFTNPYSSSDLQRFSEQASADDILLLLQDGVYALNHPLLKTLAAVQQNIFILENDLFARGLVCDLAQVKVIDDQQWLQLCVDSNNVISWI